MKHSLQKPFDQKNYWLCRFKFVQIVIYWGRVWPQGRGVQ